MRRHRPVRTSAARELFEAFIDGLAEQDVRQHLTAQVLRFGV